MPMGTGISPTIVEVSVIIRLSTSPRQISFQRLAKSGCRKPMTKRFPCRSPMATRFQLTSGEPMASTR